MKYREVIHNYIWSRKEEIVETLKELVKIPSVRGAAEEGAPFGKECASVLRYVENLYRRNGFATEFDADNGYLLSYHGTGRKSVGIFSHSDVVPVSDDWLYTPPFQPIAKEGFLIGRGVNDNKAGVVIALYCAKIMKELSLPFKSRLVLFTGSNEESGMQDIQKYVQLHKAPDFSIVPDTAFPLYRGDKGIYRFWAKSEQPFTSVLEWQSGQAFNIVLGSTEIKLRYSDALYQELLEKADDKVTIRRTQDAIYVLAVGTSKHAAIPQGSLNAGFVVADLLARCEHIPIDDREQFDTIEKMLAGIYGEYFGIENADSNFGPLTCANGIITCMEGKPKLSFDIRCSASVSDTLLTDKIERVLHASGWKLEIDTISQAFLLSEDNPFVEGLLETYREITGDTHAKSYINAGGTYARYLPLAVETGTWFWSPVPFELPEGHGAVHQPDEIIHIEGLLKAIEVTVLMLLKADDILDKLESVE